MTGLSLLPSDRINKSHLWSHTSCHKHHPKAFVSRFVCQTAFQTAVSVSHHSGLSVFLYWNRGPRNAGDITALENLSNSDKAAVVSRFITVSGACRAAEAQAGIQLAQVCSKNTANETACETLRVQQSQRLKKSCRKDGAGVCNPHIFVWDFKCVTFSLAWSLNTNNTGIQPSWSGYCVFLIAKLAAAKWRENIRLDSLWSGRAPFCPGLFQSSSKHIEPSKVLNKVTDGHHVPVVSLSLGKKSEWFTSTQTRPNVQWVYVKEHEMRETYLVLKRGSNVLYYPWFLWESTPQTVSFCAEVLLPVWTELPLL